MRGNTVCVNFILPIRFGIMTSSLSSSSLSISFTVASLSMAAWLMALLACNSFAYLPTFPCFMIMRAWPCCGAVKGP